MNTWRGEAATKPLLEKGEKTLLLVPKLQLGNAPVPEALARYGSIYKIEPAQGPKVGRDYQQS